jgi:mRNA-degrading endonuclease toxin of MazEF toxin-antitoxin module
VAGQKPKRPQKGWIYFINPYRVSLTCHFRHVHIYELNEPGEVECKTCQEKINSSRVIRGEHPHIIWTSDEFQDQSGYKATFSVIPLTSEKTHTSLHTGLPTTLPINPTQKNGLDKKSYALVHQLFAVDANCFKDKVGNWLERKGQLERADKDAIDERLKFHLGLIDNPSDDWFIKNANIETLKKVFYSLPNKELKSQAIEELINDLES